MAQRVICLFNQLSIVDRNGFLGTSVRISCEIAHAHAEATPATVEIAVHTGRKRTESSGQRGNQLDIKWHERQLSFPSLSLARAHTRRRPRVWLHTGTSNRTETTFLATSVARAAGLDFD